MEMEGSGELRGIVGRVMGRGTEGRLTKSPEPVIGCKLMMGI